MGIFLNSTHPILVCKDFLFYLPLCIVFFLSTMFLGVFYNVLVVHMYRRLCTSWMNWSSPRSHAHAHTHTASFFVEKVNKWDWTIKPSRGSRGRVCCVNLRLIKCVLQTFLFGTCCFLKPLDIMEDSRQQDVLFVGLRWVMSSLSLHSRPSQRTQQPPSQTQHRLGKLWNLEFSIKEDYRLKAQ